MTRFDDYRPTPEAERARITYETELTYTERWLEHLEERPGLRGWEVARAASHPAPALDRSVGATDLALGGSPSSAKPPSPNRHQEPGQ